MMRCPKCDSSVEESSVMCRYCRSRIGEAPPPAAPARAVAAPAPRSAYAASGGRPWEVWVVIALIALNIVTTLMEGRIGGVLVGCLIISGLLKQSNGTWWFVTVLNGIVAVVALCFVGSAGSNALIAAASCLVVVGLMVSCRVRGAYLPPDL